ncbi:GntP family gluconate:H+ symporter [Saccharopolyspora lacisalsi]|uniref:GntP family gluconate:H+ symporter n=1 Tax=Halosaccharopolyspora lacisalsi TaxID=1000566 RepID=A0A839DYC6_9PSEU|nr:gluconate:H+ symporter [Halosaccharopolyspora lacisalsi]MBA8826033.1 GntP family gluconate:H+ symporter [Halosaccharopolyspora lacisalsi]
MSGFLDWLHHDTAGLLTLCAAGIALLLFMIMRLRLEPFIALLVTGLLVALAAGLSPEEIVGSAQSSGESLVEDGFGSILGHITAIVGLGTVLGALLENSGGAHLITRKLLTAFGEKRAPLAMGLSGFVFGIPVFFDIGIFVLAPLVYVAARQGGRSILLYCLPLAAGLSVTHAFLPPHPGPVVVAGLLDVDLGWLIAMGLACGVPAFAVGGVLFPSWIGRRIHVPVPEDMIVSGDEPPRTEREPALATIAFIIGLPLVLILAGTFSSITLPEGALLDVLTFLGSPVVALTFAVLLAFWLLGTRRGMTGADLSALTGRALRPLGMILLVVGAGGFFGEVLSETGVGEALAGSLSAAGLPVLVSAYVISSGLRVAQGSATVAIVTTGGILAPLLAEADHSQPQLALIAVAISAGSITASHVNDGGFWIISRYFGIPVAETLKTWTVLETILSLVGFGMAVLLSIVV